MTIRHHWRVEHLPTGTVGDVIYRDHGMGRGADFSIDFGEGNKLLNAAMFRYLTRSRDFIVPGRVPKGATGGEQTVRARPTRNPYFFVAAMSMLPGGEGVEDFRMICHVEEEEVQRRRWAS